MNFKLLILLAFTLSAHATQYGDSYILTNSLKVGGTAAANAAAALELNSTTKGFLISRMTSTQRDAISSPPTALMIYNTTTSEYEFYDGSTWSALGLGDVTGPATSTSGAAAIYSDTTGKVLADSNLVNASGDWSLSAGHFYLDTNYRLAFAGSGGDTWGISLSGQTITTPNISGSSLQLSYDLSPNQGLAIGPYGGNAVLEVGQADAWFSGDLTTAGDVVTNGNFSSPTTMTSSGVVVNDASGVLSSTQYLPVATGGTGVGTTSAALNVFLPTQSGNAGKFLKTDGTNSDWANLTGGTNDQREYIVNGKAEADTTGWAVYADAAGTSPVSGSGGSPTVTFARTTTSGEVLRETASFKLAKDAANRQGEGASYDFTLDPQDYTTLSPIYISLEYKTTTNYASGDVQLFVIDKDTGSVLGVSDANGLAGALPASSAMSKFTGFFYPTTATSDDYRLVAHITSTNASAWDLILDSVHAGNAKPGASLVKNPDIDTLTSGTSATYTPPAGAKWLKVTMKGGGGGGAGNGSTGIQAGSSGGDTVFDGYLAAGGGGAQGYTGGNGGAASAYGISTAGARGQGTPGNTSPGETQNYGGGGGGAGGGIGGTNGGSTGGAADNNSGGGGGGGGTSAAYISVGGGGEGATTTIILPAASYTYTIGGGGPGGVGVGTGSGSGGAGGTGKITVEIHYDDKEILPSAEMLYQVPYARATNATTSIGGSATKVINATETFDSASAYDPSTGLFTCPSTGLYRVSAFIRFSNTAWTAGTTQELYLYKNGGSQSILARNVMQSSVTQTTGLSGTDTVECVKGDTLSIYALQDSGSGVTLDGNTSVAFEKVPDLSVFSTIGLNKASQAEMEAGTSSDVVTTPARQQFHPSAAKAWASFNASTGAITDLASYNASLAYNSVGNYTMTFTNPFSSGSYACVGSTNEPVGVPHIVNFAVAAGSMNVNSIPIRVFNLSGSAADANLVSVVCFGDQ